MTVTTVNLDDDLVEWADKNHARLGYRSRSALVNDLLAEKREAVEETEASA